MPSSPSIATPWLKPTRAVPPKAGSLETGVAPSRDCSSSRSTNGRRRPTAPARSEPETMTTEQVLADDLATITEDVRAKYAAAARTVLAGESAESAGCCSPSGEATFGE